MRDWVIPLLRSVRPEFISEKSYEEELQQPVFVWRRVGNLLHHNFEMNEMVELLGFVLCHLPKTDFDRILWTYPFFIFSNGIGFCQQVNVKGKITLVIFSSELMRMGWSGQRGAVAHELAHLCQDHFSISFSLDDPKYMEREKEADELCYQWGFGEEIKAARKYLSERRKENGGH